jgi:pimeloyl-ACP methyl ester carboxylesterase
MLMLHGFPEFWYSWRRQLPAFARDHRVVALDGRGYNESEKPRSRSAYAMPELVKDVRGVIDRLGGGRAVLVGHDWGGAVAWAFAYEHPDMLDALAVLNLPHPARFAQEVMKPRQMLRSWYAAFFQLPWLPERLLIAGGGMIIGRILTASAVDKTAFSEQDIRAYREAATRPGAATAMLNYYRNAFAGLVRRRWGVLQVPTLMIWGENDVALGKELTYGTEAYVEDLTVRYIPNCSHWVQQEQPELVNGYLRDFLRRKLGRR